MSLYICNCVSCRKGDKTFCGGTLKAFVLRSTLVHVSMHGRTIVYPTNAYRVWILNQIHLRNLPQMKTHTHTNTHRESFNGLLSRTTWVGRYQKDKPFWILLKQRWWGGSGISQTVCKSFAPCSRQITMPAPHHSSFYGPDALPVAQPTASKHCTTDENIPKNL